MFVFGGAMQNYAEVYEKKQAPYQPMLIRCFLILWRRKRDYGPIFAIFLPFLYVLHTANNTHSR